MGWRAPALIILVALRVIAVVLLLQRLPLDVAGHYVGTDSIRFHEIAVLPGTPYRDFEVEVPPVEYGALKVLNADTARATAVNVAWSQLAFDLIVAAALMLGWGEKAGYTYLLIGFSMVPYLYFRLDLLSIALAVTALALARRGRQRAGGIALALGVLTKAWPLVLVPVLALERRTRALVWATGTLVLGFAAWVAWTGWAGPVQVGTFRGSHGWQIESIVGSLLLALSVHPVVYEGGANRIGAVTNWARVWLVAAFASMLGVTTSIAAVNRPRRDGLLALTAVALLLVFSPILSWQYVGWLLPWAAIALADREWAAGSLAIVVAILSTLLIFQGIPLTMRSEFAENLLLVRNALLIALAGFGMWRLAHRRRLAALGNS